MASTRLSMVLDAMKGAGVDERWCLGDLAGDGQVSRELVDAARTFDLLIAGTHDGWFLGVDRVPGSDVFRLSPPPPAPRHGIDCWHGSPRHPLFGFVTEDAAARILPGRAPG